MGKKIRRTKWRKGIWTCKEDEDKKNDKEKEEEEGCLDL